MQSESTKELDAALLKAQADFENVELDASNPHFQSKFASAKAIKKATSQALQANGLVLRHSIQKVEGEEVVVTRLSHTSGEWVESHWELKPTKSDPQGRGSACTYGKRYNTSALLDIVAEADDDGNQASAPPRRQEPPREPEPDRDYQAEFKAIVASDESVATKKAKLLALHNQVVGFDTALAGEIVKKGKEYAKLAEEQAADPPTAEQAEQLLTQELGAEPLEEKAS